MSLPSIDEVMKSAAGLPLEQHLRVRVLKDDVMGLPAADARTMVLMLTVQQFQQQNLVKQILKGEMTPEFPSVVRDLPNG